MATSRAHQSLDRTIQNSLGSLPATVVRVAAVGYLLRLISETISLPIWWLATGPRLNRDQHPLLLPIAVALVVFLMFTGLQNFRTQGRLAWFTSKLGFAILMAALIRVHEGWSSVLGFWSRQPDRPWFWATWRSFTELVAFAAPLGLLASEFASRLRGPEQVRRILVAGVAIPVFVVLLLVGIIDTATYSSSFYQPSLNANVFMALWSKAASSALLPRMLIVTISAFGIARFGVMLLPSIAQLRAKSRWRVPALVAATVAISWSAVHPYSAKLDAMFEPLGRSLGVTSAIITADFLTRRRSADLSRFNRVGCTAFLIGIALPWYVPHVPMELSPNPWWYPWLLPSYVVAFVGCIVGRFLEQTMTWRKSKAPMDDAQ